jgi:hypothetical protein
MDYGVDMVFRIILGPYNEAKQWSSAVTAWTSPSSLLDDEEQRLEGERTEDQITKDERAKNGRTEEMNT